jgi:hypothetical protein
MGFLKADAESEAGTPPSADLMKRMGDFIEEITKAGVLLAGEGLKPSSEGKRVKLSNGQITITDGPFAEAKELVAGYAIYDVPTIDEAIHWTRRFLEVLGEGECELRPIFEASDFPSDVFPPEEVAREEATRQQMQRNAEQRQNAR